MRALLLLSLVASAARADIAVPADAIGLSTDKCEPVERAWNVPVTVDLSMRSIQKGATVTGTVSWRERRTRARLDGERSENHWSLVGTLSEIGGLGTVWKVRLVGVRRNSGHWHVALFELLERGDTSVICSWKL